MIVSRWVWGCLRRVVTRLLGKRWKRAERGGGEWVPCGLEFCISHMRNEYRRLIQVLAKWPDWKIRSIKWHVVHDFHPNSSSSIFNDRRKEKENPSRSKQPALVWVTFPCGNGLYQEALSATYWKKYRYLDQQLQSVASHIAYTLWHYLVGRRGKGDIREVDLYA